MKSFTIRLVAAGLLSMSSLALTACHDADAATRSEVAQSLMKAADDAFLAGSDKNALEKVVRTLKGIQGGSPQQESTRDRLLASTQFHIAVIDIAEIELMGVAVSRDMLKLRAMADAAANMSSFAKAREQIDGASNANQLAELRDQIRSKVQDVRQQASQLDSPVIDTLEQLNAASENVARLRRQADRLREQASQTSPMQRYPLIEQAIEQEREADRLEAEMMRQELALDIIHRPAKEMLEKSQADHEEILSEIDAAQQSLQESSRQAAESASKARQDLRTMDATLTTLSKEISGKVSGELRQAYQAAEGILQQAQANARKAGRNGVGRLAKQEQRLLQARIELAQADLGMMQIRGLDEWIRVLDVLSSNVDLGNRDAWGLQAQEARNQREGLAQKVSTAIDAALSTGAGSKTNDSTRAHLEASKAFVTGNDMPTSADEPAPANSGNESVASDSSPASSGSGNAPSGGFDSPQALVDAMKKVMSSGDLQKMPQFQIDNTYFSNAAEAQRAQDGYRLSMTMFEIANTAKSAFGGELTGPLGMMAQGSGAGEMLAQATYSTPTVSGDTATVVLSVMGMEMPFPMIKANGKWYLDGENEPMSAGRQLPNVSKMLDMARGVLEQIKSGQISNQNQLDAALQSLMSLMMGG